MIVIIGGLLGLFIGLRTAKKRGGNRLDMAQYGTGFALAFIIAGMILTILIDRII